MCLDCVCVCMCLRVIEQQHMSVLKACLCGDEVVWVEVEEVELGVAVGGAYQSTQRRATLRHEPSAPRMALARVSRS